MVKYFGSIIDLFTKQRGAGIAILGLGFMAFILAGKNFSFIAKVVAVIVGLVVAMAGLLSETPLFRRYAEGQHFEDE
jgi:hypothetical protein